MNLWCVQKLAREWSANATDLIRAVHASSWQIGFLGYKIIGPLISAVSNETISTGQVRYAIKNHLWWHEQIDRRQKNGRWV
jgi:hypothetical protein